MKKLTKLALILATASAVLLTGCNEKKDEAAKNAGTSQLAQASKDLGTISDAQYEAAVKTAIKNTEEYRKANLTPADVKLAPPEKQIVRYNQGEMPYTIDPSLASYAGDADAIRPMFDTLVRMDRTGEIVPVAAESYETSEDGKTWTFHLRKDAKWSDGKPVTAQDFLYSWRRLADPKTGAIYSFFLTEMGVVNADEVIKGELPIEKLGIKALDDYTFEISLIRPLPWLLQTLGQGNLAPLRQDVIEAYGSEWTKPEHIVVNGPYKLQEYKLNDIMLYVKRDDYWGKDDIIIEKIQFDFIQNAKVGYYNYLKGLYPSAAIPKDLKAKVLEERPEELIYIYRPSINFIKLNNERIKDVRVRKAISLLTNRRFLVNKILGTGEATTKLGPSMLVNGEKITEQPFFDRPYEENSAEAIKLLKEAGYTKEKPFLMNYLSGSSDSAKKLAVAMQKFYEGESHGLIKFEVEVSDGKTIADREAASKFDFLVSGWYADYDHISNFFNIYRCGSSQNTIGYCNPEFDALLDKASVTKDPEERADLYRQVNDKIVGEDFAIIPYEINRQFLIKSPAVAGYSPWLMTRYFRDWFFIDGKEVKPTK